MSNYSIPYHDVDILIPAQKFEIKFSYTSSQMPKFIDSMIMRLLRGYESKRVTDSFRSTNYK